MSSTLHMFDIRGCNSKVKIAIDSNVKKVPFFRRRVRTFGAYATACHFYIIHFCELKRTSTEPSGSHGHFATVQLTFGRRRAEKLGQT